MKKFIIVFLFLLANSFSVSAQSYMPSYVPYTPVETTPRRSQGNSYGQRSQPRENLQTITAYFVNSRNAFEKIRIKVQVVESQYGSVRVYVRKYFYKAANIWCDMNSSASPVTTFDANIIQENFDWKCNIPNPYIGTVYF